MPITNDAGGTTITGNAINWLQVKIIIRAIDTYCKFGMQLARNGSPAHLRALASQYTGKQYSRSRKGLEQAGADLAKLVAETAPDDVVRV